MKTTCDSTFPASYQFEVLDQLPVEPDLPKYYYPGASSGGKEGLIVHFRTGNQPGWIGEFACFDVSGKTGVFTSPNQHRALVVSGARAILVEPEEPTRWEEVPLLPIANVVPVHAHGLLLLVGETRVVALAAGGKAWETKQLASDGVQIDEVEQGIAVGRGWSAAEGRWMGFAILLNDGSHEGGVPPLDQYPPWRG